MQAPVCEACATPRAALLHASHKRGSSSSAAAVPFPRLQADSLQLSLAAARAAQLLPAAAVDMRELALQRKQRADAKAVVEQLMPGQQANPAAGDAGWCISGH